MGISKDDHKVAREAAGGGGRRCGGRCSSLYFSKNIFCFSHVPGTASNAGNTLNRDIDKQESTV